MLIGLVTILKSIFISLGVGSSTLAITNFFVAIADGTIDEHERKMMGVVYVVLRVAMVGILFTVAALTTLMYIGGSEIGNYLLQMWLLLMVLYGNATLMTLHKMPSSFGPAIQASAWYSMGIITAMKLVGWSFSMLQGVIFYFILCTLLITGVNLLMMHMKNKKV